ncbi:conserved hypothetical protein [Ahrensia sp. R2A130]|nr:conserved hypothetical protein [Ahrensia sp. R2A130]
MVDLAPMTPVASGNLSRGNPLFVCAHAVALRASLRERGRRPVAVRSGGQN